MALVSLTALLAAGCGGGTSQPDGQTRTDAAELSRLIEDELQDEVTERAPNLDVRIGDVECQYNADGETATCLADGTEATENVKVEYFIDVTLGKGGRYIWKTSEARCSDLTTREEVPC